MKNRTLNSVCLIGNLTRKPVVNQTSKGISVSNFHLITNRTWKDKEGKVNDEAERHICLAWSKLAEICSELLDKGDLVYIEGRLSSRSNSKQEGDNVSVVVVNEMILLNPKNQFNVNENKQYNSKTE